LVVSIPSYWVFESHTAAHYFVAVVSVLGHWVFESHTAAHHLVPELFAYFAKSDPFHNKIMEARIVRLEQQLKSLTHGVKTRDLSLAASIREWNGNSMPVTEFLTQIEQFARVSNWNQNDLVNILKLKLTGEAWLFVNGRDHLLDENVTYETLKAALIERFTEKLPTAYYYRLLHEATQEKNETPNQFLDRCRALSAKTIRKTANPIERSITIVTIITTIRASVAGGYLR
jgi:hypothetical protein